MMADTAVLRTDFREVEILRFGKGEQAPLYRVDRSENKGFRSSRTGKVLLLGDSSEVEGVIHQWDNDFIWVLADMETWKDFH